MEDGDLFASSALGQQVVERVREILDGFGDYEVRSSTSQLAFRRRRGFAFLWRPGRYLAMPQAEVVLSLALGREVASARFKEVVHPSSRQWMHHLEVRAVSDLDDEVVAWLREAYDRA